MSEFDPSSINILFVDDEPNILRALKRLMAFEDFQCDFATSAQQALEKVAQCKFDIIISDMRMPQMQGDELLIKIKELLPQSRRFILSGFADFQSTINALNNGGIHQFISKPWDDEDLINKIKDAADYINVHRERDHLRLLTAKQNKRLKNINKELEEKVTARTQELQQTADMLDLSFKELKSSYENIIHVFSDVVQLRTTSPKAYVSDVADVSLALARRLGLTETQQETIFQAAKLHEIGKIKLADHILQKPIDKLSPQEFKEYKEHPTLAFAVLTSLDYLAPVSHTIRSYCEQMNGNGFPDRLAREQISIEARILGIVSRFYLYRHGMQTGMVESIEQCKDYIRHLADAIVDSSLIDVLFELVENQESRSRGHEIRVSLEQAEEGMVLSRNLANSRGMQMLTKGTMLSAKMIERLQYLAKRENTQYQLYVVDFSLTQNN